MSIIDIESLLAVISEAQPAGEDLEYDADFLALTEAASGTPERRMGGSVVAAQEPDWRRVLELGNRLLQRSKDLRIAVLLTRALLQLNGLPGLHAGFGLMQGLITRFWDGLYPELDAGDNNDPTARMNVLTQLTDRDTLLTQLRVAPLIRSRVFGPISWRDIDVAEGRTQALAGAQPRDAAAIEGAFQECDLAELAAATATAEGARDTLRALIQDLNQRVEPTQTPDLTPLTELLSQIHGTLQTHLTTRQPAGVAAPADTSTDSPAATSAAGPAAAAPGQIGNREDVVRTLDRICDYYSRYEPSSPVPLLLKRARRLATGSFVDIMRDLAPDALPQIENVCGISDKP
jgi:type VI secretion system protein ImpA